jgi:hypothetical protein
MLADEITGDLRNLRLAAMLAAAKSGHSVTVPLISKGINYGAVTASPSGAVDTSRVQGVDPDLRVKPFFAEGSTISMREFIVGALHKEMGLEVNDPDLAIASTGGRVVTPAGMVLDGSQDIISGSPSPDTQTGQYEIDPAIVDHLEFYLLNYFKPALGQQNAITALGRSVFDRIGWTACVVVLIAGALQFTAWKARHLACCREAPGRGRTLPADAGTAWRHGLRLGLHCSYCCAGLTANLLVIGVMDLRAMAVVTAAITVERLAPAGQRVARAIGAVVVGAGLFLIARAAGLG